MSLSLEGYPQPGLDDIRSALQRIIGQPVIAVPYVHYRQRVLEAQWAVWARLQDVPGKVVTAEEVGETRTPLITGPDVTLPPEMLTALLATLSKYMERDSLVYDVAQVLADSARVDAAVLQETIRRACFPRAGAEVDDLADELSVSPVGLGYLGRLIGAPFVRATGEVAIQRRAGSAPARGISGGCVVCGAHPTLAILDGQVGRRTLCCSLCGFGMPASRRTCPFCGNCDENQLTVLGKTDDVPWWVEYCSVCGGYVKTTDRRRFRGGDAGCAVVQDIITLHLDLRAQEAGYTRSQPYVALT